MLIIHAANKDDLQPDRSASALQLLGSARRTVMGASFHEDDIWHRSLSLAGLLHGCRGCWSGLAARCPGLTSSFSAALLHAGHARTHDCSHTPSRSSRLLPAELRTWLSKRKDESNKEGLFDGVLPIDGHFKDEVQEEDMKYLYGCVRSYSPCLRPMRTC